MTAKKRAHRQTDRESVLARLMTRERLTAAYSVSLTQATADAWHEARAALIEAEIAAEAEDATDEQRAAVGKATAVAEAARQAAISDAVTLRFVGLPADVFDNLVAQHKPADGGLRWDPKTFRPALIAATCVDPGFDSTEQVIELFQGEHGVLSEQEVEEMFATALSTCIGVRSAPA